MEPSLLLPMGFGAILVNLPLSGASPRATPKAPFRCCSRQVCRTSCSPCCCHRHRRHDRLRPPAGKALADAVRRSRPFGIFFTVCLAGIFFDLNDAVSIGVIGAADGPTAIFVANTLGSQYLGAIMVAAYSYMALVPIVQPPVIRAVTTKKERRIRMAYQKGRRHPHYPHPVPHRGHGGGRPGRPRQRGAGRLPDVRQPAA